MTIRLDLLGRVLLILLGSVLLLGTGSVTLLLVREQAERPQLTFPRLRQVAGIVDLMAHTDTTGRDAILRAANGVDLVVRVAAKAPPPGDLRRAPRLEAQLRRFVTSSSLVAAYVSPHFKARHTGGRVEGFLARADARLPDGRYVSLTTNPGPERDGPQFLGLPASLWMGGLAAIVALLALTLTAREMRPLRDLARATRRFDGTAITVTPAADGASDIRLTSIAVADMQARVVDLLAERSLMIATISHDLRTLLTRMRLRATSLVEGALRGGLERDLDGMDAMLADALAFARGTAASVHTHLDLADIAATEVAEREARNDAPAIEVDLQDAPCSGDAHALRRVIANLLDNAAKYGGGQIRLSVAGDREAAWLRVDDDGPGIPADQRAAVLAPYHRGDDPQQRRLAGSGLGLAIVQQIVRAHGGAVTIANSPLGGAAVTVRIACRAAHGSTSGRERRHG